MKAANPIILFDGVCNLCNSSVRFIHKRDKRNVFSYRSLQSEEAQQILNEKGMHSQLKSIVFIEEGEVYTKSTAVLRICKYLKQPYPLFAVLTIVPRFFRDGVYSYVAQNRYKWFGKQKEVCEFDPSFNPN